MGKKRPQKTKEVSVAIAEASSTGDETHQILQAQPQTPRKRGRPRKIVEKSTTESSEDKKEGQTTQIILEQAGKESLDVVDVNKQSQSKRVKITEEEEEVEEEEQQVKVKKLKEEGASSAAMGGAKQEEGQSREIDLSMELPRRRGRRKSKPRKSS